MSTPRAFISHSHSDRPLALRLGEALRAKGVDAWIDRWEIQPGDSIVQKVFEEGLKDCKIFVVLLSNASLNSQWVKSELDAAFIQRLNGATRVIPVLAEKVALPPHLNALLRIDLDSGDFEVAVEQLVDVAFDLKISTKPPLGSPPKRTSIQVHGLTPPAAQLAARLAQELENPEGEPEMIRWEKLESDLDLKDVELKDAIEELKDRGVLQTVGSTASAFGIMAVVPKYQLALMLDGTDHVPFSIDHDLRALCAALVAANKDMVSTHALHEATSISVPRFNMALRWAADRGLVKYPRTTRPGALYAGWVQVTGRTRRFVEEHAK